MDTQVCQKKSEELDILDPLVVRLHAVKTAFETASLICSIDEILSITKAEKKKPMAE